MTGVPLLPPRTMATASTISTKAATVRQDGEHRTRGLFQPRRPVGRDTGALDRVEELITRTVADADAALRDAPLGVEATRWLRELAHDATTRTA